MRDGISKSKPRSGIAIGWCRKLDGLLFYYPHTKTIYSSGDYKLDEGRNTPNTLNLHNECGIFVGLYGIISASTQVEPYAQGTSVVWHVEYINKNIVKIHGTVISVPIPPNTSYYVMMQMHLLMSFS